MPEVQDRRGSTRPDADRLVEDIATADERGGASWLLHCSASGMHTPELLSCDSTLSGMATSLGQVSGGSSIHIMLEKPGLGISHFHARLAHDSDRNAGRYLVFADESQLPLGTTTPADIVPVDQGPPSQDARDTGTSILEPITLDELTALDELASLLSEMALEGSEPIRRALYQAQPGETPRWELLGVVKSTLRHSLRTAGLEHSSDRVLEEVAAAGWVALHSELRGSVSRDE